MSVTFDRFNNEIKVGNRVIDSESNHIGVISEIYNGKLSGLELRLSECVKLEGIEHKLIPAKLMKIEKDN